MDTTFGPAVEPSEASLPSFGRAVCRDYARSSRLEWLLTNGTGGFAMGSVAGTNTRRYHGLLIASLRPPAERILTLARLEETLLEEHGETSLATNQYPGTLYPRGFLSLESFRLDPLPTWTFRIGDARIQRSLFLVREEQTVVAVYRSNRPLRLRVEPLLAFRDYHGLCHRADPVDSNVVEDAFRETRRLTFRTRPDFPPLFLHHPGTAFSAKPEWHENVEYLEEFERGLDFREDLFLPGSFILDVRPEEPQWVVATLAAGAHFNAQRVKALEVTAKGGEAQDTPSIALGMGRAAGQFLARREDGSATILAGYPWFTDWGRDTMISLPGLLLAPGNLAEARRVLEGFLAHLDGGLVPNRFPDQAGPAEYNSADATLWMFEAAHALLRAGGEHTFLTDTFYPAGRLIIEAHLRGTHHDIHVDAKDGLLIAGGPGTNLTWMDARVDGQPVTPRHGKPVEVNALFYNALRLMEGWAKALEDVSGAARYRALAETLAISFEGTFWNPARACLFDVILPEGPDARLRPNQLMALSLTHPLLSAPRRAAVLKRVEETLLTPVGLRTLARGEPGYISEYRGGPAQRDAAYHQGLVWPWLLGPYVDAYLRVHGEGAPVRHHCRALLVGLEARMLDSGCLGSLSECFEPEAPFRAVGAPAQAWSVAELLRLRRRLSDEGEPVTAEVEPCGTRRR